MDIQLTDALEIAPAKTATTIALRQVSIFYGLPDDAGHCVNGVKIALNCQAGDGPLSQTSISLHDTEANAFIDALSKLVEAAIVQKFSISEAMRKP